MADPTLGYKLAQQGVNLAGKSNITAKSTKNPKSTEIKFRYPLKMMDENTDYIKIVAYEYEPPGFSEVNTTNFIIPTSDTNYKTLSNKKIIGTVFLPIPQTLPANSQTAKWGEGNMNALTAAGIGAAQNILESGDFTGAIGGEIAKTLAKIKGAVQTGAGQGAFQSFFAANAIQALTGKKDQDLFGEVLARETGLVMNENVELLFRGVNLRGGLEFNFDLAPRDAKESEEIRRMVLFLKKEMSPRKGSESGAAGGLFLTPPSVFKVEYMSGGKPHPYLNRFKICALTNLNLNFTASNTYTTYSDGTPVHMTLTLAFSELTPIYAEDYDSAEGTTGIGY